MTTKPVFKLLFKISRFAIMGMAILQLALSQIHVVSVLLFDSLQSGLWLFMFILFGLVALFAATRLKIGKKAWYVFSLVVNLFVCFIGIYYLIILMTDTAQVPFGDYALSFIVMAIGILVYFVTAVYNTVTGLILKMNNED